MAEAQTVSFGAELKVWIDSPAVLKTRTDPSL